MVAIESKNEHRGSSSLSDTVGMAFQEFDSQKGSLDVPVSHPL